MKLQPSSPTQVLYGVLQHAYDFFNKKLFEGQLPTCLITVQREKSSMGYFSANRWASPNGNKSHELALNPAYFGNHTIIEVLQTLVHEQCHLWQHEFGKPVRASYHNAEWSKKMESIGLIPSNTGKPGGKKMGQQMSDYPAPDGHFLQACVELLGEGFALPWVDRFTALSAACQIREPEILMEGAKTGINTELRQLLETPISELVPGINEPEEIRQIARKKRKQRYHCDGCGTNVWGKPRLNIICGNCNRLFGTK